MSNTTSGVAQKLANRRFPERNKPSGLKFTFPFKSNAIAVYEEQLQLQTSGLEWISGVFVDNSKNTYPFTLYIQETGQAYTIPSSSQASLSLIGIMGADKVSLKGETLGDVNVPITLLNFEGTGLIWSVLDPNVIVGGLQVFGAVTAYPAVGAVTNGSGTITLGGTPQLLFAANATRRGLRIYNLYSSNEILGVSIGAGVNLDTAGIYEISPGGVLEWTESPVPNQAIYVVGATTGHKFSAHQL